jgi:hypothetical protein
MNHFARCCQQGKSTVNQTVNQVSHDTTNHSTYQQDNCSDSNEVGYTFGLGQGKSKLPSVQVGIGDQTVVAFIDSCSSVNMINKSVYDQWVLRPE